MRTPETKPIIAILAETPAKPATPCKCRRCGRRLTSPESQAAGVGPVCAKLEKMCPESCPRAKAKKDKGAGASQLELDFKPAVPGPTGKALRVIMGLEKP